MLKWTDIKIKLLKMTAVLSIIADDKKGAFFWRGDVQTTSNLLGESTIKEQRRRSQSGNLYHVH